MTSHTTERFRRAFAGLPPRVQSRARQAYRQFSLDPFHPGLQLKQIHSTRPIYSVRIGLDYRALGVREGDSITWFWIGSHAEYDRLVANL